MKRFKILLGMLVAALLLAGCAATGSKMQEGASVKCPYCGHEFSMASEHPEP